LGQPKKLSFEENVLQVLNPHARHRVAPISIEKHLRYAVEALREYGGEIYQARIGTENHRLVKV